MRLNKYIAHSGVCSRRKADQLIGQGQVTVNGQKAECGYDVKDGDEVSVAGRIIRPEKRLIYYILNKPEGYITSVDDEQGRQTVLDLMPDIRERIYPVGRLDYNTSGMLIMTNDGDLAYKLTSPHKDIFKTYVAEVAGLFLYRDAEKLRRGVDIGGYVTKPAENRYSPPVGEYVQSGDPHFGRKEASGTQNVRRGGSPGSETGTHRYR